MQPSWRCKLGSHQYMYVYMYVYSVMTVYIVMIMDELVKGTSIYRDENPKTEQWGTSNFRSQRGEEETAERTEGATHEIGELKEECPRSQVKFLKNRIMIPVKHC